MTTDFVHRHKELSSGFRNLSTANSGVMSGFSKMHREAMADGELPSKIKELIALAISITSHCDGCIAFHTHDAVRAGASATEIEEAIGVAILMGGGPAAVYASDALEALSQFTSQATDS